MACKSSFVRCINPQGLHLMHYTAWGDPAAAAVVCVHGLTRNGRDFDFLAEELARDYHVLCPDLAGRGKSQWLPDANDYGQATYLHDLITLLAAVNADAVHWIGTSLGGLLGMILASYANTPLASLTLNDIGPTVPKPGLARMLQYLGNVPSFDSLEDLEQYLRVIHAGFGITADRHWKHLRLHGHRRLPDGKFALHYDPAIAQAFARVAEYTMDFWALWERIKIPTLLIKGGDSDVLTAEILDQMRSSRPGLEVIEWRGVGHAPALMDEAQIQAVKNWLDAQR